MHLVARAAGADDDETDDVLEAGFSEHEDGSGVAVLFQRARSAPDPWLGAADETDLFDNTYCITVGSGQTVYGGLRSVEFTGAATGVFHIEDQDADVLGLEPRIDVEFRVVDADIADFKRMLHRVVTWGIPAQVPALQGFGPSVVPSSLERGGV